MGWSPAETGVELLVRSLAEKGLDWRVAGTEVLMDLPLETGRLEGRWDPVRSKLVVLPLFLLLSFSLFHVLLIVALSILITFSLVIISSLSLFNFVSQLQLAFSAGHLFVFP